MQVESCDEYISPSGNHTWNMFGQYFDTLSSVGGCDSIIDISLDIITVDTFILTVGDSLKANQSDANYQWYRCENNNQLVSLTNETNQTFKPKKDGFYAVAIEKNNCSDTSECVAYKIASTHNEIVGSSSLKLFPNPTNSQLNIEFMNPHSGENVEIVIIDVQGRVVQKVFNGRLNTGSYKNEIKLEVRTGVNFVRVSSDFETFYNKVIVKY
ncbi:MAG: hypothetical protein ACJAZ3_000797 [Sphingobacteriales bacterium]|jgi:hypothetical protein